MQSISSVLSDEDIIINGGTLTIANSSQLNGALTVGPGGTSVLNGSGDVTVAGLTSWTGNGSTIGGGGTLFANAGVDIDFAGGTRNLARTLQMNGTSTWTTGFGGTLNGGGQVVNLGTLDATNTTDITVNSGFDNTVGTINKNAGVGTLTFAGGFNNDNQVTIDAGTVNLANTSVNTGGFTVNGGGTLQTSAGTVTMSGATVSGAGMVLATAGTLVVDGASTYSVGDTQINGGTITFNTNVDTTTLTIGPGGSSVLNGTGDVVVAGLTSWTGNGSTIGGGGTLFANAGVDIDFAGGTRNLDRTLEMSGTSTWTTAFGGALNGSGQVVNLGTLNATNPTTFNVNTGFDNTVGTINKSAGVGGLRFAGAFNNDNQVTVDAGAVDLANTGTHTGVFTVNAGGTLQTSAGTVTMSGATVSGAGTVLATAGTLVVDGASTYSVGDTQINGGTITFNTNVDTTTLTVGPGGASVLNGTGDVTVAGLTSWTGNGSTIGGSGTLFANAGVDIDFAGGTRNLDRTLEMSGTSTWTTAFGGSLNGAGQVVNLGTLNATNATAITVNTGFDNQGIFNKSGAGTFTFGGIFTNSGTLDAQNTITSFTNTFTQTAGTTELSGGSISTTSPMSFTGGSLIGFGTITGDVSMDTATLSPGSSPDILNVTNLTLTANSIVDIDVDGITPGIGGHDQINVTNNATIDGTLNVVLGFAPAEGDTFDFLTCGGTCSGTFTVENLPANFLVNYSAALTQLGFSTCTGSICWDNETGDGLWTTLLNWNTDLLPAAGDDVVIDLGGISTVTLDDTAVTHTIESLLLAEDLEIVDGTLMVTGTNPSILNGDLTISGGSAVFDGITTTGNINVAGGDLDGTGDITATGLVNWTDGDIVGAGKLIVQGGIDIDNATVVNLNRTFDLDSLARWPGAASFPGTGLVNILAGATFDLQTDTTFISVGPTFNVSDGGTLTRTGDGNVQVRVPTSSGTVESASTPGSLILQAGGTFTDAQFKSTGGSLNFGGGGVFTFDDTTEISGSRRVSFGPGTHTFDGIYTGTGALTVSNANAVLDFNTDADFSFVSLGNASMLNLNGSNYTIDDLTLSGGLGTPTLTVAGDLSVLNDFDWLNGDLSGSGSVTIAPGATLNYSNAGTSTANIVLNNQGITNVQIGTLIFNQNGTHGSSFDVATGSTIEFAAGTHSFGGNATFQGGGTVELSGAAWNVTGDVLLNAQLDANAGSVAGSGNVTFNTPGQTHTVGTAYDVSGTTTVTGTNTAIDVSTTATFGTLALQNGGDANLQAANIGMLSMGGAGNALTASGALSTTTANLGSGCTVTGTGSWASNGALAARAQPSV